MPRRPRPLVMDGYYHVIVKGAGNQILFEEEQDYRCFLRGLRTLSEETGVGVCAYCLMENHVHLLLHDAGYQLPRFMQRLGVHYAKFYNLKYSHKGHLFQNRYKSFIIDSEEYFITVLKYIICNPEKENICRADDFPWNSYEAYFEESIDPKYDFIEKNLVLSFFADTNVLRNFLTNTCYTIYSEYDSVRTNDALAMDLIQDLLGVKSGTEIQQYSKQKRNESLRKLKEAGLSIRQIERLTGINRGVVLRA